MEIKQNKNVLLVRQDRRKGEIKNIVLYQMTKEFYDDAKVMTESGEIINNFRDHMIFSNNFEIGKGPCSHDITLLNPNRDYKYVMVIIDYEKEKEFGFCEIDYDYKYDIFPNVSNYLDATYNQSNNDDPRDFFEVSIKKDFQEHIKMPFTSGRQDNVTNNPSWKVCWMTRYGYDRNNIDINDLINKRRLRQCDTEINEINTNVTNLKIYFSKQTLNAESNYILFLLIKKGDNYYLVAKKEHLEDEADINKVPLQIDKIIRNDDYKNDVQAEKIKDAKKIGGIVCLKCGQLTIPLRNDVNNNRINNFRFVPVEICSEPNDNTRIKCSCCGGSFNYYSIVTEKPRICAVHYVGNKQIELDDDVYQNKIIGINHQFNRDNQTIMAEGYKLCTESIDNRFQSSYYLVNINNLLPDNILSLKYISKLCIYIEENSIKNFIKVKDNLLNEFRNCIEKDNKLYEFIKNITFVFVYIYNGEQGPIINYISNHNLYNGNNNMFITKHIYFKMFLSNNTCPLNQYLGIVRDNADYSIRENGLKVLYGFAEKDEFDNGSCRYILDALIN